MRRAPASLDYLLVALVALVTRTAHAYFVSRTSFFEGPVVDAESYRALGRHIAQTGDFGGAFYQPPLYPTFLAALFRSGLDSAWSVALVQSALGAATAVLLVAVGRRLSSDAKRSRAVGLISGLAAALYGPLVLFDVELLPAGCVNLLLVSALLLALRQGKLGVADALLGLLVGLLLTAWPMALAFVPALLALRARALIRQKPAFLLVAVVSALPPLVLTARHNAQHEAKGVLVSYNLGINLWLGNNPAWRDTWRARPGARFEPELERPDREGVTRPGARSDYFVGLVSRDLAARPLAAVGRTVQKLYYVWCGHELRRDHDLASLREASPVLRLLQWDAGLAFPFGLLAPLGLLALWRRRHEPSVRYLGFAVVAYGALLAVFFVSSRYRLPLVVLLLPLAAEEALRLLRDPGQASARAAALATVVLLNLPSGFARSFDASPAERGVLAARSLRNQGKFEQALAVSARSVERFGDDPDAHMVHAELLLARGRCRSAEPHLRRVLELAPRTVTPRLMLADCLASHGDSAAAERQLASALALHPYHPIGLKQAAALYLQQQRSRQARPLLERFLASGYRDAEVSDWLRQSSVVSRQESSAVSRQSSVESELSADPTAH